MGYPNHWHSSMLYAGEPTDMFSPVPIPCNNLVHPGKSLIFSKQENDEMSKIMSK